MRLVVQIVALLAVPLMISCAKENLSPKQYVNYIREETNGLNVSKQVGDYEFRLLYKPYEYIALMQDKDENISRQQLDQKIKPMKGLQYFTLTIRTKSGQELMREGISEETEYYDRLDYLVSYMQNDLSLIDGNDTLPCVLYHFERNYNTGPDNNLLLGFDIPANKNTGRDKTLVLEDQVLGTGKIMIRIAGNDINRIPQLQLLSQ